MLNPNVFIWFWPKSFDDVASQTLSLANWAITLLNTFPQNSLCLSIISDNFMENLDQTFRLTLELEVGP